MDLLLLVFNFSAWTSLAPLTQYITGKKNWDSFRKKKSLLQSLLRWVLLRRSMPPFTCEARPGWGPTEEFHQQPGKVNGFQPVLLYFTTTVCCNKCIYSSATGNTVSVTQSQDKDYGRKWKTIENMHTHNPINSSKWLIQVSKESTVVYWNSIIVRSNRSCDITLGENIFFWWFSGLDHFF